MGREGYQFVYAFTSINIVRFFLSHGEIPRKKLNEKGREGT